MFKIILDFVKTAIEQHGYGAVFGMTTLDQFLLPIPVDVLMPIGTSVGLSFEKIMVMIVLGVFAGALIGYGLGKYLGHPIAVWLFGKKTLDKGERFIQKWGMWGVVFAGIIPFPFKIIPWLAGIFEMKLSKLFLGMILGLIPRYFVTSFAGALFIKTKFYATVNMSAVILGAIQGITEFLPISSSGHLVIMEQFLKLPLAAPHLESFDIVLHGGSLLAILIYFWKDWWKLLKEMGGIFKTRRINSDSLFAKLALGTVPAIFGGLFFAHLIDGPLRKMEAIAICFIIMAVVFFYVEWKKGNGKLETVSLRHAVLIGFAQAVALIPAISRSGMTIVMGMFLGIKRDVAARFSFMLGGVAILAAIVYMFLSLKNGVILPNLEFTLIGFFTSFLVSLLIIFWFVKFLSRHTLRPFAFYSLLLGAILLFFF
ncbi:MAG: undecaprenyl-diphosphate phosphatase [Candidatus Peregrinibacteria bacterium]